MFSFSFKRLVFICLNTNVVRNWKVPVSCDEENIKAYHVHNLSEGQVQSKGHIFPGGTYWNEV